MAHHLCFHSEHGPHECCCAMDQDHTTAQFRQWHAARGIEILPSQIA